LTYDYYTRGTALYESAVHCRARTTERQGSEEGWAFPTVAQSGAHAAAASLLRHRRGLCARKCGLAAP